MLEKVNNCLKRGLLPVSRLFNYVGLTVLALMVPMTVADVLGRRLFGKPILGMLELTSLSLIIVSFLILAYCGIKGGHIEVEIITARFPKRMRSSVVAAVYILTTAMLGAVSWQLFLQAIRLQHTTQTSGLLRIPTYPFIYIAALGSILLTLVYLMRFFDTLIEARK
jgi:TRAP-type C4-dicarboxylate transport system permease small subunit